jgi:hypothetical protein
LAIGREIEAALGADQPRDVLTRWMSYRLAEVRLAVEQARDAAPLKVALAEQDRLILALWAQRGLLPNQLAVDRRLASAAAVIATLLENPDLYRTPLPPHTPEQRFDALSHTMRRLVTVAAIMLFKREALARGPEDPDLPLSDEEAAARKKWADLSAAVAQGLHRRAPGTNRDEEIPDADAVALFEQEVRSVIVALRDQLDGLELALFPAGDAGLT